jgi:hypothetical protein
MKEPNLLGSTVLKIILLALGVTIFLVIPFPLPSNIGVIDFRPYWSSSFLLAHGQDYSDTSLLYAVERGLTGWNETYTMHAWFAPTGNVILLPYTIFSFTRAASYWLLTNIAVVFLSTLLIWSRRKNAWIPILAAFGFSLTLLSLIAGQMNTLVVLGLAIFLFFSESRRDYLAGIGLALTTIKPHLVILTLPLLLIDIVRRKQWRTLAGFVLSLLGFALILFALYPQWPVSFWNLVTVGMSSIRQTPTITGLLVVAGETTWGKWIWIPCLFFAIAVWWKYGEAWDRRTLIDVSILGGLLVSPIGWSYDQVMLLFPILRILEWSTEGSLEKIDAISVTLVLILANAITFVERILSPSEVWFFWVPLVVAALYRFAWKKRRTKHIDVATIGAT